MVPLLGRGGAEARGRVVTDCPVCGRLGRLRPDRATHWPPAAGLRPDVLSALTKWRWRGEGWLVVLAGAVMVAAGCAFSEPALAPLTRVPLTRVAVPPVEGKTAAVCVMTVDQNGQRLYVADALDQGVDVIDVSVSPGRYLETIHL